MSNKVKMKCAVCHKTFNSNKASQLLCDNCERAKRRKELAAPTKATTPITTAKSAGKPTWLAQSTVRDESTPFTTEIPPELRRPDRPPRPASSAKPTPAGKPNRAPQAKATEPKPPRPPRPPRVPKPPTPPFIPTSEQIALVEQRYRELAQPEFDGIRTQISQELSIPKRAVKEIVAALRAREHLPSWWEAQGFAGAPEDLERIRVAYEPHLPVPPLGIHKEIAKALDLPPTQVYHGIAEIRRNLGLAIFNDPSNHPEMQQPTATAETTA